MMLGDTLERNPIVGRGVTGLPHQMSVCSSLPSTHGIKNGTVAKSKERDGALHPIQPTPPSDLLAPVRLVVVLKSLVLSILKKEILIHNVLLLGHLIFSWISASQFGVCSPNSLPIVKSSAVPAISPVLISSAQLFLRPPRSLQKPSNLPQARIFSNKYQCLQVFMSDWQITY